MNNQGIYSAVIVLLATLTACAPISQKQLETDIQNKSDAVYNVLAAEFALREGENKKALEYYKQAVDKISDPEVLKSVVMLAYEQKDYKTAAEFIEHWAKIDPDNIKLQQRLTVIYLSVHDVDKATRILEKMSDADKDKFFLEVSRYGLLGADDKTLNTIGEVAGHFLNNYMAQYLYASLALHTKQYALAIDSADRLIMLKPERIDAYKIKARAFEQQGNLEEAIAILREGVRLQIADKEISKNYARMLIENQEYQEAYEASLLIYGIDPNDPEILQLLGSASLGLGDLDSALQYFEALANFPGLNLRSRYFQAHVWYRDSEYEKALALLHDIPTGSGDVFEDSQLLIARIYQDIGQPDTAIKQLQEAREDNEDESTDITFYLAEGELLRAKEAYSEEYLLYSDAIEEYGDVIAFRYFRALAANELGHLDLMEADIQSILAMQPANVDALNALGYCLADKNIRLDEAKAYIVRALELSPDNPAVIDSLGWVEFRLNNLEKAEILIRSAREKIDDPIIDGHLVEILRAQNQSVEAQKYLQDSLEKFPDNKYLKKLIHF